MRAVKAIILAVLTAASTLGVYSLTGDLGAGAPASAVTPQWVTTDSSAPLTNVRAVSCAPSSSAGSTTCVAVGDDGSQIASIIESNDGGATWSPSTPPTGVTSLSAISCPSASICYAGGGSGIMKSTDGGSSWTVQDAGFPTQSISCFTIDECTAVGGVAIVHTSDGSTWVSQTPPNNTDVTHRTLRAPMPSHAVASERSRSKPSIYW